MSWQGYTMRLFAGILTLGIVVAPVVVRSAEAPSPGSKVFKLHAQNGSHEYGTVALKPHGDKTGVEIHLINAPQGVAQPAHVHAGSCTKLDPAPKYPLPSVLDGTADVELDVPLATLMKSPMAVNIHKSTDDLKDYVACADLTAQR